MIECTELTVTGMKCGGCETNVSGVLTALGGVSEVSASSKNNTVNITFDTEKMTLDVIKKAITDAGFTVVAD